MIPWMMAVCAWAGRWVLDEQLVAEAKPPVPVGWTDTRALSRWVVDWTPGEPIWTAHLCSMQLDPVLGARMGWPDALLSAVSPQRRPVAFDGVHFSSGPVVETLGAQDEDRDGKPGVTIHVTHPRAGSGEVYVQRTVELAWDGTLGADGQITGTVRYRPDQQLLGASTWWLRMGIRERAHAHRASHFTLTPAPGGTRCADLQPVSGR